MSEEIPWTEEDLEHFQAAYDVLPYLSAMLQNDDAALQTLFETESKTMSEVGTGLFSLCAFLADVICDLNDMSRMEVIQQMSLFLSEQLNQGEK